MREICTDLWGITVSLPNSRQLSDQTRHDHPVSSALIPLVFPITFSLSNFYIRARCTSPIGKVGECPNQHTSTHGSLAFKSQIPEQSFMLGEPLYRTSPRVEQQYRLLGMNQFGYRLLRIWEVSFFF